MAPVKFEENLREKLEQRAITPTNGSWDKLADKLDAQEVKKSNKGFWWIGIAASIVAIIIVSNSFFNSAIGVEDNQPIQVVNGQDSDIGIDKQSKENESITIEDNLIVETENESILEIENNIKSTTSSRQKIAETKPNVISTNQEANTLKIASNFVEKKENEIDNVVINNSEKSYALVETQHLNKSSENLDNEIESLLSKAQKNVSTQTAINKEKSKINAKGLLDEVEFDLDESFRDKVFQKLKTGYKKVSTSVAHRND